MGPVGAVCSDGSRTGSKLTAPGSSRGDHAPVAIVVNLVTFEHVAEMIDWARMRGMTTEIAQVSIARGTEILSMTRLQAENPVTVVTLSA